MKIGQCIYTPRFCTVKIKKIFDNVFEAYKGGFKEPTYYDDPEGYEVLGRSIDLYHMEFAAVKPSKEG